MPEIQKITDMTQMKLIGVYLVQKLGQPTLDEIIALALEKLSAELDPIILTRALSAAQKRDFLAINLAAQPGEKGTATVYSMKKLAWRAPPEYAHVADLLPRLLETSAAKAIKTWFDDQEDGSNDDDEEGGKGNGNKRPRGLVIADYHAYEVHAQLMDPLIGSQIPCAYWEKIRQRFPNKLVKNKMEADGIWARDQISGAYVIAPDALHGWFAANATRWAGLPDERAKYVAFEPLHINPKFDVEQLILPVVSQQQQGAKPKAYEAIQPGEELIFRFSAPTKGFLSPEQLELMFNIMGLRPKRGISPARGRRFGRFVVTKFVHLGAINRLGLEYLAPSTTKVHRESAYFQDAMKRLANVTLSGTFAQSPRGQGEPFVNATGGEAE